MRIEHPIPPLYSADSKILILGSFPSVKSREVGFFYGHPQNRFWRVIAELFGSPIPHTIEEKSQLILNNQLALWDVIASCDIMGSADSSIREVVPNDLSTILKNSKIEKIFVNGKTAEKYYDKYQKPLLNIEATCLPSTSAANASWNMERLKSAWQLILHGDF